MTWRIVEPLICWIVYVTDAGCCTLSCLPYVLYEDDLSAFLFFTCATLCQARGDSKLLFLVWMYWFSTIAWTDVALEISRLRSIWQGFGVVEIFGFGISVVSSWYISVLLFFITKEAKFFLLRSSFKRSKSCLLPNSSERSLRDPMCLTTTAPFWHPLKA